MQAFYIENQILNMLGIRGMTIDGITTSTLPNMADTQQVEVSGMQYENIFEVSSPFRINAIDAAYATTAQKIVNQTRSLASRNTSTSRTRARRPAEPGRYHIILARPWLGGRCSYSPPPTRQPKALIGGCLLGVLPPLRPLRSTHEHQLVGPFSAVRITSGRPSPGPALPLVFPGRRGAKNSPFWAGQVNVDVCRRRGRKRHF